MANDTTALLNVVHVDDRNGNHYWICDVWHTTGTDTDVLVPNSVLSAAQIPDGAANGGSVTITNDTDSTAQESVQKEVVVASAIATGLVKLIIRFSGSAAGMGSGHADL